MKKIITILILAFSIKALAQEPTIQWQKCLGGSGEDHGNSIQQTSDGGYIVAGQTASNDGNVSGIHGFVDFWVVKLDSVGSVQWQKCLGGSSYDAAYYIRQTFEGGYILTGTSISNDGDLGGNHGGYESWVVKLDTFGNIQWQKCLGGINSDEANSIEQTSNGGYILAGTTDSNNGDVSGNHGSGDYWVVRLDSIGNIEWQKCLGGTSDDGANSIQQTADAGFIVAGSSLSNNGDVSGNHGFYDYWVVKLDSLGNIEWQKCLGGTGNDRAKSIVQTSDRGYIVVGDSRSNNGDVSGNHATTLATYDYWIVKLDTIGVIKWQKCLGGSGDDDGYSIQQTSDRGYIVAGETSSNDGNVSGIHSLIDSWVVKLDSVGNIQWQKCLGGTNVDLAYSVQPTFDGGYIVAGSTLSIDGDVNGNHDTTTSYFDYWVVKLAPTVGIIETTEESTLNIYPNPAGEELIIKNEISIINEVSIYNVFGVLVMCRQLNAKQTSINLSSEAKGVYFIKIKDSNQKLTFKKIVIQ